MPAAFAQQRTVDEVKKSIGDLSADLKTFTTAQTKMKNALTNEATKNLPETWFVAGKIEFGIYDKNRVNKSVGNTVDAKAMGTALINGYDYFQKALSLDTIKETNRDGSPKLDKKTGEPKVKTKFSKEIVAKLFSYVIDFGAIGADLYKVKEWEKAYKAWDVYHQLATSPSMKGKMRAEPDSVIGAMSFYQGLAASQLKKYPDAHRLFVQAISYGYTKKTVYDNDINALILMKDTAGMVNVATQAFKLYGKQDVQYMRIMINDCLRNGNMDDAEVMLDQAILMDSLNANYYTIKGNIVEDKSSYLDARPYYKRAVELSPETYQTNFDMGRSFYLEALQYGKDNPKKTGKKLMKVIEPILRTALTYLEKAHELEPGNIDTIGILRDVYYKIGDGVNLDKLEGK